MIDLSQLHISQDTIVTAIAVLGASWGLKEGMKKLIIKLIEVLTNTVVKVEILDAKMTEVLSAIQSIPKMKEDLNSYYKRLRVVEEKITDEH